MGPERRNEACSKQSGKSAAELAPLETGNKRNLLRDYGRTSVESWKQMRNLSLLQGVGDYSNILGE